MKLIDLDWYFKPPIDFEHKQYLLYAYLNTVDESYLTTKVSPHLLHLERLKSEMEFFVSNQMMMQHEFDRNRYIYFDNPKLEGENNTKLTEISEIINFATPQIISRIKMGNLLFEKYPNQILF